MFLPEFTGHASSNGWLERIRLGIRYDYHECDPLVGLPFELLHLNQRVECHSPHRLLEGGAATACHQGAVVAYRRRQRGSFIEGLRGRGGEPVGPLGVVEWIPSTGFGSDRDTLSHDVRLLG